MSSPPFCLQTSNLSAPRADHLQIGYISSTDHSYCMHDLARPRKICYDLAHVAGWDLYHPHDDQVNVPRVESAL